MAFDVTLDDTLAFDADASFTNLDRAIFASDTLTLTEQLLVETSFNTDSVSVSDQALAAMDFRRTASDAVAFTDTVAVGFVRWANPSDTVAVTDEFSRAINYGRSLSDTAVVSDVTHTWSVPDDEVLEANFESSADLRAVLIKRKAAPASVAAAPPRTVKLPRPPKELLEHNVVDPNPPNRQER